MKEMARIWLERIRRWVWCRFGDRHAGSEFVMPNGTSIRVCRYCNRTFVVELIFGPGKP